jgi:hypothetical protein
MLEIIHVCTENHTKTINTALLIVKADGTCSYRRSVPVTITGAHTLACTPEYWAYIKLITMSVKQSQ